jgi:uncharacterized protein YbjQ (UPF0145 family)
LEWEITVSKNECSDCGATANKENLLQRDPVDQGAVICLSCLSARRQSGPDRKAMLARKEKLNAMSITTETAIGGNLERLGIVGAEYVDGLGPLKEIGAAFRNITGGRVEGLQNVFAKARAEVINKLKLDALELGADAVVAVRIEHNIEGAFLLVTGTGTAIKKIKL